MNNLEKELQELAETCYKIKNKYGLEEVNATSEAKGFKGKAIAFHCIGDMDLIFGRSEEE